MKLALSDRCALWCMNALLFAVACPLWVMVIHLSITRGLPAVRW